MHDAMIFVIEEASPVSEGEDQDNDRELISDFLLIVIEARDLIQALKSNND